MKFLLIVPFLLAVGVAGSMGTFFQTGSWYEGLAKPSWTPPNWAFPIAWTLLYIFIAVAGWRVAVSSASLATVGLSLWALQMVLNVAWSPVVFGAHDLLAGLVIIVMLLVSILATMVVNFRIDSLAGWLFVPYAVWVSYATALNTALWRLNP